MDLIKIYSANVRGSQDLRVLALASQHLTDITSLNNFKNCLMQGMERMKRVNHTLAVTSYRVMVDEEARTVEIWKRDLYGVNKKMIAKYLVK